MDAFVTMARKQRLIISDVKTRVGTTMPNEQNSRAARMQVSLYHRLLDDMIDGSVGMTALFTALGLDSGICFSDAFLVEAGMAYSAAGIMDFDTLMENNNLTVPPHATFSELIQKLWQLVQTELSKLSLSSIMKIVPLVLFVSDG
jgi:Exonuclease V - a 5' deoxyribonuclease